MKEKKTEPKYFENIRTSNLFNNSGQIEIVGLKKIRKPNMGNSPIDVKNLLITAKKEFNFKPTDEFWLIIDKDHWEDNQGIDLDKLLEDCKHEKNFFLALSNPCFELWFVLHFKDVSSLREEEKKLLRINNKVNSKKNYIDQYLGKLLGRGYNKNISADIVIPKTRHAIINGKKLDKKDPLFKDSLGTGVYKLVEKLISIS